MISSSSFHRDGVCIRPPSPCASSAAAAQLVAGIAIIMLGAGIPLAFALLLRRNRHRLYDARVYSSFGLLYEGLSVERGTYAWTSIDMVKKILVVLIASLIKSADFQQVAACVLLVSGLMPVADCSIWRPGDGLLEVL